MLANILLVLGSLTAVYGVAIFALNSGTWFFAVWFVIAALLLASGIAIKKGVTEQWPVRAKRYLAELIAVVGVIVVALCGVSASGFTAYPDEDVDAIVVLGAQVKPEGPSTVLQYRLDTAYEYYVAHPEVRIICSGGQGANEPEAEGTAMAKYLMTKGVPEQRIMIEDKSTNTVENLEFSADFLNKSEAKVAVVTNNFHVFRAVSIAKKLGYQNACGLAAPSHLVYLPNNVLREAIGVAKDFVVGNI